MTINALGTNGITSTCFPVSGGATYQIRAQAKHNGFGAANIFSPILHRYSSRSNCESDTGGASDIGTAASVSNTWTSTGNTVTVTAGNTWARARIINLGVTENMDVDAVKVVSNGVTVGLDLAETYPTDLNEKLEPGHIVAFGTETQQNGADVKNVVKTSRAYDRNAFGVVTTQPGIVLDDEKQYEKVQVALKGRVPVLVTTENGPIKIGDPITASSKPGVGMKATQSGRIVGYAMTAYENPDPTQIDQVTIFVNPETYIDMSILTDLQNGLKNIPQSISQTAVSAEKAILGVIDATAITTEKLVASTIKAGTATIDTLIVDRIVGKDIQTESLSALNIDSKNIKTDTLEAETLSGKDASLSGKLVAQEIDAENIREFRKRIEAAVDKTQINEDSTKQNEEKVTALNEKVSSIEKYIDDIKNEKLTDAKVYQNVFNDIPVDPGTQQSEDGRLTNPVNFDNLFVTGQGAFYSATVTDNFTAGNIFIKDNEILALNNDLRLNALETVNILDGAVIVDRSGKMTVKGEIIAQGGVRTNTIKAVEDGGNVNVVNSDVSIINAENKEVASIDASGSAKFADLSLDKYTEATSSAAVIAAVQNYQETGVFAPAIKTNAAATGNGFLPAHNNDIVLFNDKITSDSLVYITATSSTDNRQLYVAEQNVCPENTDTTSTSQPCHPYFKVALDGTLPTDTTFNWWIVN